MDKPSDHIEPRRVSQKELAEALGVSSAALTKARNAGRIVRGDDGLYDLGASVAAFRANRVHPSKPGVAYASAPAASSAAGGPARARPAGGSPPRPSGGTATPDFFHYRTLQMRESYLKAKLERRRTQRELVERAVIDQEWQSLVVRTRDAVLQVPHAMAAQLASESDPRIVRDLLIEALEAALTRLCDAIEQDETDVEIAALEAEDDDGEEAASAP